MDQSMRIPRCSNCGTEWTPEEPMITGGDEGSWGYTCPVCQYHVVSDSLIADPVVLTSDDLQDHLARLLTQARASGITSQEIVALLREELAFEAELSAPERRMLVQIIDLGPLEAEMMPARTSRQREYQHSRSLAR